MKLEIRCTNTSDMTEWNNYVFHNPEASPYHNYAWVKSVEHAYKHQNTSIIALSDNKIVGLLPIIKMSTPLKKSFLCSLPFCDLGYALADNEEILNELLAYTKKLKSSIGANDIQYRDRATTNTSEGLTGEKVRMLLTLPESSELLMKSFKSKLRSQIRKAEKNGLTYKVGNSAEMLNEFYHVLIYNMRKLGSPVHSKKWFEMIQQNYGSNLLISIIYTENTPIGAGIVLLNNDKACIPWASTLAEYNRLAPNMLLYWSLLKEITDSGLKEFDFGRSTYGEGTFKFKKQWGAQAQQLNWKFPGEKDKQTPEKPPKTKPSQLRGFVEKTWSRLPIKVTTIVGPIIRKHISL